MYCVKTTELLFLRTYLASAIQMPSPRAVCRKCEKKGIINVFSSLKQLLQNQLTAAAMYSPILAMASLEGVPVGLKKSSISLSLSEKKTVALVNSVRTNSFIHQRLVDAYCLKFQPIKETISMPTSTLSAPIHF